MHKMKDLRKSKKLSVNDYQDYLKHLYPNNKLSSHEIYAYLDRTTGYLGKVILDSSPKNDLAYGENAVIAFVRPLSWLLSLATRFGITMEEAFVNRFPNTCPYCLEPQCVCYKTNKRPLKQLPAYEVQDELFYRREQMKAAIKVLDWDRAAKTIKAIYAENEIAWHYVGPWRHVAKMHEETSEIHEAYVSYLKGIKPLKSLADEMADAMAWILGAWVIVFPSKSLDAAFVDYYIDDCPVCHSNPCNCKPYSGRVGGTIGIEVLIMLREFVITLSAHDSTYRSEFNELIKSFDRAIETQNEPVILNTIDQAKDLTQKFLDMLSPTTEQDREVYSIAETTLGILSTLKNS